MLSSAIATAQSKPPFCNAVCISGPIIADIPLPTTLGLLAKDVLVPVDPKPVFLGLELSLMGVLVADLVPPWLP